MGTRSSIPSFDKLLVSFFRKLHDFDRDSLVFGVQGWNIGEQDLGVDVAAELLDFDGFFQKSSTSIVSWSNSTILVISFFRAALTSGGTSEPSNASCRT